MLHRGGGIATNQDAPPHRMTAPTPTPSSSSFVLYVDESGDEGFRFSAGSSDWFVLGGIVTRKHSDLETVKLVDEVRALLKRPVKKPLHFRDLRHEHRLPFVAAIAKARLRVAAVVIHKPSLQEPEKFQERYRLYFYAVRLLLERVSWLARDTHRPGEGDGSVEVVFSSRSSMKYGELCAYLDHLRTNVADVRIHWPAIKTDQVVAFTAGKRMGLQIADAVASSIYYGVQPSQYGMVESRYAELLDTVYYRHKGRALGYGIKFWPPEGQTITLQRPEWNWLSPS